MSDSLDVCLCFGQDGQEVRGRLIGVEGGRYDQVFPRLQCHQLHHLTGVHVRLTLSDWNISLEKGGWKLASV